MDDLATLMNQAKSRPITGGRDYSSRGRHKSPTPRSEFEMKLALLLDHGQWVKTCKVKRLCKDDGENFQTVAGHIGLSESESGRWVCIPQDKTPQMAPDEEKKA
ncbi:MAG: hypothetical protein PQJ59_01750 [Spirochaetales bacterium]|nr:hypothetical protein [Spirochaetales bacterium]